MDSRWVDDMPEDSIVKFLKFKLNLSCFCQLQSQISYLFVVKNLLWDTSKMTSIFKKFGDWGYQSLKVSEKLGGPGGQIESQSFLLCEFLNPCVYRT